MTDTPPLTCPHCGGIMRLQPVDATLEHWRCGLCWLRSPNHKRNPPGQARAWVENLAAGGGAAGTSSDLQRAAQRVVNACDRQDPEAHAHAIEDLRALAFRNDRR